jgi:hypothetical protein
LEIPAVPELAVADAAQSKLHLLTDHLGDLAGHRVGRADRRQPAGMGGSDRGLAALHVGPVPWVARSYRMAPDGDRMPALFLKRPRR